LDLHGELIPDAEGELNDPDGAAGASELGKADGGRERITLLQLSQFTTH
jgi:hypothetical protein